MAGWISEELILHILNKFQRIIVAFICIVVCLIIYFSLGDNAVRDNTSGGISTHWYHSEGKIKEIDLKNKILIVINKRDDWKLNCMKESISLENLNIGDKITYYYFEDNCIKKSKQIIVEEIQPISNKK